MNKTFNNIIVISLLTIFFWVGFLTYKYYDNPPIIKETIIEADEGTKNFNEYIILEELNLQTNLTVEKYNMVDLGSIITILKGEEEFITIIIASKETNVIKEYEAEGIPNRILEDINAQVYYIVDQSKKDVIFLVDYKPDFIVSKSYPYVKDKEIISFLEGLRYKQ